MKKLVLLLLLALTAFGTAAQAAYPRPTALLGPGLNQGRTPYHQSWNRTLSADTLYYLTGQYLVDSTYTITIPAGTVLEADTASTLCVMRGGRIFANGEPRSPIVFTSMKAPGERNRGDWGGVILLGNAPTNKVEPLVEGGLLEGTYGGPDANDDSGVFKYVRIEYPGYRFQLNNEINGLTMGGVGAGTEIHHVQVSYSFDDSYEWFGGTVNPHHLVAFGGTDDEFDTDFGFSGRLQFLFALRDPNMWDPTGQSNGFESDNDASSTSTDQPYTSAVFCNCTLVGPERTDALVGLTPAGNTFEYSTVQRRSSRMNVFNTAFLGYYWGLSLRDAFTQQAALAGITEWKNNSMACSRRPTGSTSVHDEGRWAGVTTWYDTPSFANNGSQPRNPSALGLTNMANLNDPNPVPSAGSILIGTADFSSPKLAGLEVVTYRGAFDPTLPMAEQWTKDWTNFNPQASTATAVGDGPARVVGSLDQNYPNPFNPVTAIRFKVPVRGHVSLKVYNVRGEEIATVVDQEMNAGAFERSFSSSNLPSGTYFYRLTAPGVNEVRKMQLVK